MIRLLKSLPYRFMAFVAFTVLLCLVVVPILGAGVECRLMAREQEAIEITPSARPEDQTYLTFPEWYVIYNRNAYADFIAQNPPSQFPYFQSIAQFWSSYYDVCAIVRLDYRYNSSQHFKLAVIGTHFTLGHIFGGIYENSLGRLTEWLSLPELSAEDAYAQQVAKEYGNFLYSVPWYEFPFGERVKGLWTNTDLIGPNFIRKWERKLILSLQYGLSGLYANAIGQSTAPADPATELGLSMRVTGLTNEILQNSPVLVTEILPDQSVLLTLPRDETLTNRLLQLSIQGVQFVDIGGNEHILVTILAPQDWIFNLSQAEILFEMPLLAETKYKRVAVKVSIPILHETLTDIVTQGLVLEHIYDY